MSNLREVLNTWDNADSELNKKIDNTNLSTIVASATASAVNSKTVEINGTGKNVEKLVVEGKTEQNGTPSPSNPIEVKGVGDKVENLVNFGDIAKITYNNEYYINSSLNFNPEIGKTYTLSYEVSGASETFVASIGNGNTSFETDVKAVADQKNGKITITFTATSATFPSSKPTLWVRFVRYSTQHTTSFSIKNVMLVEGEDNVPFIKYGSPKYKIPISSDGKSTNVYLNAPLFNGDKADLVGGTVDKKYGFVALADLAWSTSGSGGFLIANLINAKMPVNGNAVTNAICTHYVAKAYTPIETSDTGFALYDNKIYIPTHSGTVPAPTEGYLLYELATPTKETFDGAEINTVVGKNTLSVDTEVTPASIETVIFGDYYSKAEVDKINVRDRFKDETPINAITSLDNIEVNTMGVCQLSSNISPSGAALGGNYICFGSRTTGWVSIMVTRVSAGEAWLNHRFNDSWSGWKKISTT